MSTNPFISAWSIGGSHNASSSVFGALPAPDTSTSDFLTFFFVSMYPGILNSTLTKSDGQVEYMITTHAIIPGYTLFKTLEGGSAVLIEWNYRGALVEIGGSVKKQPASMFLQLSGDRTFRIMNYFGEQYAWMGRGNTICMYRANSSPNKCLAKLYREDGVLRLEVSPSVISSGLMAPTALAAVLLQGGRPIDG
ncbi:hypothetical protein F5050DRAFT_1708796 [Lentinula boryana]|uniref:Uncharacterized protein n=1 Tax=Lentinula boryana TaxID=40481 RepID=A0ABQ8QQ90_9AGAR|nr:hypothetical protein F5050DRAFT_1708796 [Lentinula boryana]